MPESPTMTEMPFVIIGRGVYSVRDASRLTRIAPRRIRRWLRGYDFESPLGRRHSEAVLHRDFAAFKDLWLSFADLVEIRFIDAFRKAGVSWASIRLAAQRAEEILKLDHPFSTRRFKTDGHTIMTDIAAGSRAPELLDLVQNQLAFKQIVDPYLYRSLEFGPTSQAARWWHEDGHRKVVVDPARSFGKPIVAKEAVPTRVIFDAFLAEQSIERVATVLEISNASASAAVEFERRLAAA